MISLVDRTAAGEQLVEVSEVAEAHRGVQLGRLGIDPHPVEGRVVDVTEVAHALGGFPGGFVSRRPAGHLRRCGRPSSRGGCRRWRRRTTTPSSRGMSWRSCARRHRGPGCREPVRWRRARDVARRAEHVRGDDARRATRDGCVDRCGSIVNVPGSMSANTGVQPSQTSALVVATYENGVVTTSPSNPSP